METKKLTREELEKISEIQKKQNALLQELGQIGLAKLNLKKREETAEAFSVNLRQEEDAFLKELQDKYGVGTIDLGKGEFIPSEEPVEKK